MNRKAYSVCKRLEGWRIDTGNGSIVLKEGDILVFYDILLVKVISGVSSLKSGVFWETLCINNPSFIGDLEDDIRLGGPSIHTYVNRISRKREYVISFYGVRSGTNMYDMLTDVTISWDREEKLKELGI